MKELVFWQPTLSIHQSALLKSLAKSYGAKVTLVVEEEMVTLRTKLGWHKPDFGETCIISKPTSQAQSELLSGDLSDSVHVFSGTRGGTPMVWNAFRHSLSSNAHIGVYSEAYRETGVKGLLRLLRGRYDALRFGERTDFILGVGDMGVDWFKRSGYLPSKISPFGYFVETPLPLNNHPAQEVLTSGFFHLIFVGQLIPRKGWDILLNALHGLENLKWRLHIVGDGVDREMVARLCAKLGLIDSVHL